MNPRHLFLILSLVFLAACQPAGRAEGLLPFFAPNPIQTAAPLLTPSPTSIRITRPNPTLALPPTARPPSKAWSWQTVGEVPRADTADVYYTGEALIWTQKVWRSNTAANYIVYIRSGDQTRVLYETPGDWRIEMARMAGGRLALLETSPGRPSVIRLFDIKAESEWVIGARDGEFTSAKHPPNLAIDADHLVWNSIKPDGRTCLRIYQFQTSSFTDLFCTEHGQDFLVARYLRWPVITYERSKSGTQPQTPTPGIYSQNGSVSSLNCSTSQGNADGLALGCLGKNPGPNSGIPASETGPLAFDPTLQVCGGRAFWLRGQSQVRAWMPGGSEEIIYRTLNETEQIQDIRCTDEWVTVILSGSATNSTSLEVWAADISN